MELFVIYHRSYLARLKLLCHKLRMLKRDGIIQTDPLPTVTTAVESVAEGIN